MMYNMAAVYWRAVGAVTRAAECLTRAYYYVPSKFKDVVLLNMAGFFTFVNETESSLTMVKEAVDVTALEVKTFLFEHYFVLVSNAFFPARNAVFNGKCVGNSWLCESGY